MCLFNCKKYPEGGCERRGPKNIIGDWKLSLYEVNGIDSTNLINYNNSEIYKKISILKNGSNFSISTGGYNSYPLNFTDNNSELYFTNGSINTGIVCVNSVSNSSIQNCYRTCFIPESNIDSKKTFWKISKLNKNEIIILYSEKNAYKLRLTK